MARKKQRVVGASRLKRKLKRMPEEITVELRGVIRQQSEEILADMKARVPVSGGATLLDFRGRRRKHLRDALEARRAKDGLSVRIGLIGKKKNEVHFYARFLEFGTRSMRKRPFLFATWRAARPEFSHKMRKATTKALRTVARWPASDNG